MSAGRGKRRGMLALCLCGTLLFAALGIWQVQRLSWKRELIARVDARINAPPVTAPAHRDWAALDTHEAEYRRVQVHGVFRHERETLVDALTALGPGSWVLTPLDTAEGTILINRGFVPPAQRDARQRQAGQAPGEVTITGLLRPSEPGGRLLRPNQPAAERWFSRDVAAIAHARRLDDVAPFFIDADAGSSTQDGPRGGMTVVKFRNAHLAYAFTWFALAGLCAAGLIVLRRTEPGPSPG